MRHAVLTVLVALTGLLASPAAFAGKAGDLVMANRGPWTLPGGQLVWDMTREGPEGAGFRPVKDGTITLQTAKDDKGEAVLQLEQKAPGQDRRIGPFPVSGGDPVVVYFLENTVRDMASLTGGSPYYIRNRVKDALFRGGEVSADGQVQTVVLRPFADDKNAERMGGFSTLTLRFAVPADPKQPIREMVAETTKPVAPGTPESPQPGQTASPPRSAPGAPVIYRYRMTMRGAP